MTFDVAVASLAIRLSEIESARFTSQWEVRAADGSELAIS